MPDEPQPSEAIAPEPGLEPAIAPSFTDQGQGDSTRAVVGTPYAVPLSIQPRTEEVIEPVPEFADALDSLIDLYTYQYETSQAEILTALQEAINVIEGEVGSESGAPPPDQVPPWEDVELIG